eukprot:m.471223 g.471223  ORF g.471223 m.471223 type:complete len:305 (-) comp30741_c0_seq1:161-1075(-)
MALTIRCLALLLGASPVTTRHLMGTVTTSCPAELKFSSGFGQRGNDPAKANRMGRLGISVGAATAYSQNESNSVVVPCPFGELVGVGPSGARRFLCGLDRLLPTAPLFSFGSNGDFRFEDAVRKLAPSIPVVVFDPTLSVQAMSSRKKAALDTARRHATTHKYTFVPTGIAFRRGWLEMTTIKGKQLFCAQVDTLPNLLAATEHNHIGVLKIDASGEFEIFAKLQASNFDLTSTVGILLLEVHLYHPQEDGSAANCCYGPRDMDALFSYLAESGFLLVGRELGECCAEFSFVNPKFPGFQRLGR